MPPARSYSLAVLAEVLIACGNIGEALTRAREAHAILEQLGAIDEGEGYVRLIYALALRASGAEEEAVAAIATARARLQRIAGLISDPALRASFLERVPENVLTLSLGATCP